MTAALALEDGAAAGAAGGGSDPSSAPGNPLNAPGSPRRRKAKRTQRTARRAPVSDPRVSAPGSQAARQREAIEAIKADRPDDDAGTSGTPTAPPVVVSPAGWATGPVHGGAGAVLGVFGMALFINFMQGGMPQVKRWGRAKFLNKTS